MPGPAKWDWTKSNGSASAAATVAAYEALNTGGRTRTFTAPVWNDILEKISAQRIYWTDTAWDAKTPSLVNTRMSAGDNMTALRFNTAVKNMPPIKNWPWTQPLGRTDLRAGDRCYGLYFIYLTDGLNYWIDLIPVPFAINNVATTSMEVLGRVAPAIHVQVDSLTSVWSHSVTARTAPALGIKYTLSAYQNGTLYISALNAAHIRIINFVHANFDTTVTLYPTAHVIASLNAALQQNANVTFGNCEFLSINLPFHYTNTGLARVDPVIPAYASIDAGTFGLTAAFSTAWHTYLAFNLVAVLRGEPRIRELDSIPVSAALQMLDSSTAIISCQDMEPVVINLESVFTACAKISSDYALHFAAQLHTLALINGAVSIPGVIPLQINENAGLLGVLTEILCRQGIPLGVNLPSLFIGTSALETLGSIRIKALLESVCSQTVDISFKDTLHVISDILFQSEISAPVDTLAVLHIIEALTGQADITTNSVLLERQLVTAAIHALSHIKGDAVTKVGAFFAAELLSHVSITTGIQAMGRAHVISDILFQSEISAVIQAFTGQSTRAALAEELMLTACAQTKDLQATGANSLSLFALSATGVITTPTPTSVMLPSFFSSQATAIAAIYPQYTAVSLPAVASLTAAITAPAIIDGMFVTIPAVFSGVAELRLVTRIYIAALLSFQHEGQSDITLAVVTAILAVITGQHTGETDISLVTSLAASGELQMVQTVTAAISLMSLTLATEIDDVLVTDLDDMLVTDVEYKLI